MVYVRDIYQAIDSFAPFESQMDFDNSGLQTGTMNTAVTHAMVCLDVRQQAIEQAVQAGCQLIVSHHPVLFKARTQLPDYDPAWLLARHGLSCIAAHTNYDICQGGVNDILAQHIALGEVTRLGGVLRLCTLPKPMEAKALANHLKQRLGGPVRFCDAGRPIQTVALCAGGGGMFFSEAAGHADAYLTGDADHHELLEARQQGMCWFAAGHYETEILSIPPLVQRLQAAFPAVQWHTAEEAGAIHHA